MAQRLRVLIIGGGTGGLCLAQALHNAGITVSVYERGRSRTERTEGYRVRINPHGSAALHTCLPLSLWEAFLEACGTWAGSFGFVDHQLRQLLLLEREPASGDPEDLVHGQHSVSRAALHQVLSSGLGDVLQYDKEFQSYRHNADGSVTCLFADGSTATADLVVGADGANSRVRRQLLPDAERVDTGILTVAGKFPLTTETKATLPTSFHTGQQTVIPPRGCGMFIAPHELTHQALGSGTTAGVTNGHAAATADATVEAGIPDDDTPSYVLWAYAARRGRYPSQVELSDLDGTGLRGLIGTLISDWHPVLRRLVADSPAESVSLLPILTAVPVPPWPTSNITLLGDAIHSMTPFRGIGANTALRDAELLSRNLIAVAQGRQDVGAAVSDYESQMRDYGFAAVRNSLRTGTQLVSDSQAGRTAFKAVLRLFSAIPPLKRKVFSTF